VDEIMNYLLDTCTLLWLTFDPARLSAKAASAINDPLAAIHVSALAAWELGIKVSKGKLGLPLPVGEWFPQVLRHYRFQDIPITSQTAAASTQLPPVHQDPFDRLLIATALEHQFTLITADRTIPNYPSIKTLW
jgi:PIN domain nuclease of toxin-antitoxin system